MSDLETAAASLDNLATAILTGLSDDRPFNEIWGWNLPPLSRHDIAAIPSETAAYLRKFSPAAIPDTATTRLPEVVRRAQWIRANVLPNLPGGNAWLSLQSIQQFCIWVRSVLPEPPSQRVSIDWKEVETKKLLPPELTRRLRNIEASLKLLEPRTAAISDQIETISAAQVAAENLPTTRSDLEEALAQVNATKTQIQDTLTLITDWSGQAGQTVNIMKDKSAEADKLLKAAGVAYHASATKGLAEAFSSKAWWLNASVYFWGALLIGALGVGAWFNGNRFDEVYQSLSDSSVITSKIWVELALMLFGLGAPVWFAWVATRQITERFRLAEDYGFKAAIGKAYEGYRLEAIRLDRDFEARLFDAALTRLEDEPLRHVDKKIHGSPFHEFFSSSAFGEAIDKFPNLNVAFDRTLGAVGDIARIVARQRTAAVSATDTTTGTGNPLAPTP